MVDINLIGDDNTGEEERPEEFTQTASLDTEELAFEERTETFDTTKTAGFARKRNYSSLVSTLIVFGAIALLGGAIYFFMLGDDEPQVADNSSSTSLDGLVQDAASDDELARLEQEFAADLASEQADNSADMQRATQDDFFDTVEDEPLESTPVFESKSAPPAARPNRSSAMLSRDEPPVSDQLFSRSRSGVRSVTGLMGAVPSDLSTTLLSFSGETARVEIVANSASEARAFTSGLGSIGNFVVISEDRVSSRGQSFEKVVVSGKVATNGTGSSLENVRYYSKEQASEWIRATAKRYGLTIRELKSQAPSYSGNYQKVPLLGRIHGNQSSLLGFLEEIGTEAVNLEFAKILLVSPDMVSYSDDNLVLILNLFVYEQG